MYRYLDSCVMKLKHLRIVFGHLCREIGTFVENDYNACVEYVGHRLIEII